MKFVCERCQTKYSIADDKVRGKILKVRCKTCSNVVTVREPSSVRPSVSSLAPVRDSHDRPSSRSIPSVRAASASSSSSLPAPGRGSGAFVPTEGEQLLERTAVASLPQLFAPPPPPARAGTPAAGTATGDGIPWFMALDGHQHGPFSRQKLIDRLMVLPRDADIHVWNERMDGWKEPKDVPDVAREIARRRAALAPLSRAPAPPPPPAPVPPPPPVGGRSSVSQPVAGHQSVSQPVAGPLGTSAPRLPRPSVRAAVLGNAVPAVASASAAATLSDPDPAATLDTPVPVLHAPPGGAPPAGRPHNGAARSMTTGRASVPAMPLAQGESDALNALNLSRVGQALDRSGSVPAASSAPRLMSVPSMMGTDSMAAVPVAVEARQRSVKFIAGLIGFVLVTCLVILFAITKKPPAAPPPAKVAEGEGQFAALAEQASQQKPAPPPVVEPKPPQPPPEAQRGKGQAPRTRANTRAGHTAGRGGVTNAVATAPGGSSGPAPDENLAARFRETNTRTLQLPNSQQQSRITVSQSDISRVINNNKNGIKACYQRALLRDSTLTHGKIAVHLAVGISGRVKTVAVDGPTAFRALEPCIREVVSRWMFPPSSDGYETEFSYVFQGNG